MKKTKITMFFILYFASSISYAFDPRDFIQIDKTKFPVNPYFFDLVTNQMGVTVQQVSGDGHEHKSFVTYELKTNSEKIEFFQGDSFTGFEVSKTGKDKTVFYKTNNHKIHVRGLQLGMGKEEVKRILAIGKVKGGFTGTLNTNWSTKWVYDYSRTKDDGIWIYAFFDHSGKLSKFSVNTYGEP
jgi:hypothetical protein